MATESSVVVALREVRRLEFERQRREDEARARRHAEQQAHEEAARRAAEAEAARAHRHSYGDPYGGYGQQAHPHGAEPWGHGEQQTAYGTRGPRRTAEVIPLHPAQNFPGAYGDRGTWPAAAAVDVGMPDLTPRPRSGSSLGAVLLTTLVLGAAGAAGYRKLNQDFDGRLRTLELDRQAVERARNDAVEARAKLEQESRLRITELEQKLAALTAQAAAAPEPETAAPGIAAPVAPEAQKPAGAGRATPARQASRSVAKADKPAARLEAKPAEKPFVLPKVAGKKSVNDDPLGGLKGQGGGVKKAGMRL